MNHLTALVCSHLCGPSTLTPREPLPGVDCRSRLHANSLTPVVFIAGLESTNGDALDLALCAAGWQVRRMPPSGTQLLQETAFVTPSCLVLDVTDPRFFGLLRQARLEIPVICIISEANVAITVLAMKAGALDVLAKPIKAEELTRAIGSALEHGAARLAQRREASALRERYALLTLRERQVMALVVSGRLNKQIGGDLGISEITVKAHRGRVMRKMDVRSLAALVRTAAKMEEGSTHFERGGASRLPIGQALRNSRRPDGPPFTAPTAAPAETHASVEKCSSTSRLRLVG